MRIIRKKDNVCVKMFSQMMEWYGADDGQQEIVYA